jgi:CDP-6-deoxy-D-xylo-4-hexulose-3-dehydrase
MIKIDNKEIILKTFKRPIPGQDYIPVTGKVIEEDDLLLCMESVADGWLTAGRFSNQFEY